MPRWIELEGPVQPRTLLRSPLSGKPCVLYRVRQTLLQRLLEGPWRGGSCEKAATLFWLHLARQVVLINPTRAQLKLPRGSRLIIKRGLDPAVDDQLARLYRRLGRHHLGASAAFVEQLIMPGDHIRLAGWLHLVPDASGQAAGYRQPPRIHLVDAERVWLMKRSTRQRGLKSCLLSPVERS